METTRPWRVLQMLAGQVVMVGADCVMSACVDTAWRDVGSNFPVAV